MSVGYLHGVETLELESGSKPIKTIKTSVVALVGTAPIFELSAENQSVNKLKLITNPKDAKKYFGTDRTNYSIPSALDAIFAHGSATVVVCNVFDPATHKTTQAETAKSFVGDVLTLGHEGITNLVLKHSSGAPTYVAGTDYTLDAVNGIITRKGTTIASGANVLVAYTYADVSKVSASNIIGTTDIDGNRSGLQALLDTYALYGIKPKIIIAPAYCTQNTVAASMRTIANNKGIKGYPLIDAPIGTAIDDVITGRGSLGTINFNVADKRVILCYPHLKSYNPDTAQAVLEPYSQRLAGVIVKTDREKGFHYSPSNEPILGIIGTERPITCGISDPDCEANLLNSNGIVTIFNDFGTGFSTWGNRNSAFPSQADIGTFIACHRTQDAIEESIEFYQKPFLDKPITNGLIDSIVQSVNNYLNMLKSPSRGAIIDGKAWFDPANNPAEEIAQGNLRIDYSFCPPPPLEHLTLASYVDISFLSQLGGKA